MEIVTDATNTAATTQQPPTPTAKGANKRKRGQQQENGGGKHAPYKGPWKCNEIIKLAPDFITLCDKKMTELEFYRKCTMMLFNTMDVRQDPPNTPAKTDVKRLYAAVKLYEENKHNPAELENIKAQAAVHIARGPCIFDAPPEDEDDTTTQHADDTEPTATPAKM